jgi:hypothetical protein
MDPRVRMRLSYTFFFECRHVRNWHQQFSNKYLSDIDTSVERDVKKMWLLGILPGYENVEFFSSVSIFCFQYCIWEAKLNKKIPSFTTLEISFSELIDSFLRLNKDARESATKLNLSLCRHFGYGYVAAQAPAAGRQDPLAVQQPDYNGRPNPPHRQPP